MARLGLSAEEFGDLGIGEFSAVCWQAEAHEVGEQLRFGSLLALVRNALRGKDDRAVNPWEFVPGFVYEEQLPVISAREFVDRLKAIAPEKESKRGKRRRRISGDIGS